ncbi:MAG: tetratricopeptide repeat protein [Candidatus Blackburnbacteria bacterium]|nr:tetratricopeptide repeat protein [Candidatus Blackburnbacteria bacterium]
MNSLQTAQKWFLKIVVFLLPLFFIPATSDFFEFNKLTLIVVGSLIAFLLWALASIKEDFKLHITPFDLPVLAFLAAVLASAFFATPNKMNAFVFPGTAMLIGGATLLYLLVVQTGESKEGEGDWGVLGSLIAGASVAAFIAFLGSMGVFGLLKFLNLPAWLIQGNFNTLGGLLPAVTFFIALLPVAIGKVLESGSKKHESRKNPLSIILNSLFLILLILGIAATTYHILPGKPTSPKILPISTGWSIALETLKREPLLGVGIGNFAEAFNRFRPVEFNSSDVWNLRFGVSSNWYLDIFTVAGVLGFVAFLWLVVTAVRLGRSGKLGESGNKNILYSLYSILILFALVPASLVLLFAFYVLLGLLARSTGKELRFQFTSQGFDKTPAEGVNILSGLFALLAIVGLIATIYFGRPVYAAEVHYKKALENVAKNDGLATYNNLRDVVRLNPRASHYRVTNSQINLALANSIAANVSKKAQEEKKEIAEQDRNNISQLIQQAIGEAKAAVALDPGISTSWANLAQIYRSVMGIAQGADQFAIAAFRQAIALEPTNPALRLNLGGIFYGAKDYEEAVKSFELAVAAKNDFANAHYNLAVTLRDQGKTARAAQELRAVLGLVSPGSQDYETVRKELEPLERKLQEEAAAQQAQQQKTQQGQGSAEPAEAQLQAPQPAPSPIVEPPIELPQDSEPPATITPTPTK